MPRKRWITRPLFAVVAAGSIAAPAHAATVAYASDAAFLATANFASAWFAEGRWGDNMANGGDWEIGLVNGQNTATYAQAQHSWTGNANHSVALAYDAVTSSAVFTTSGRTISATGLPTPSGGINALAVRARADAPGGDVANVGPLTVQFAGGGAASLFQLVGDLNAEYLVLVDPRLAGGFSLAGDATLSDGRGSLPSYQFKLGYATPVPLPAAAWLLLTALAGLGVFSRARPARAHAAGEVAASVTRCRPYAATSSQFV